MDDAQVHSFHTQSYVKAEDLGKSLPLQRAILVLRIFPMLVIKSLVVVAAEIYFSMLAAFHWFVPKTLKDIRGQLAAVTGGSNGIGREICLELARCGCNVACLDVDLEAAQQLCTELNVLGIKANAYKVDVTDHEQLEVVKKQINADMGVVDILINNAGLMPQNSFRDGDASSIRRVIEVNVLAHFWTTRVFIGDMVTQHYGHIVGICSMIAFYPMSTAVTYTTSKYAVRGFMDSLNRESQHENWGVKTTTVFPHLTSTRKEIVDYLRKKVKPSTLERVRPRAPAEVGKETVAAIRRESGYVTVPRYYLLIGKFIQSLSFEVQNIADNLFMPRITSKTNHTAAQSASALDNGFKKSQ